MLTTAPHAELMLAWSQRKGYTVPAPGAIETLMELKRRGYRLGIIIEPPGRARADEHGRTVEPDAVIHSLSELLIIFPELIRAEQACHS